MLFQLHMLDYFSSLVKDEYTFSCHWIPNIDMTCDSGALTNINHSSGFEQSSLASLIDLEIDLIWPSYYERKKMNLNSDVVELTMFRASIVLLVFMSTNKSLWKWISWSFWKLLLSFLSDKLLYLFLKGYGKMKAFLLRILRQQSRSQCHA